MNRLDKGRRMALLASWIGFILGKHGEFTNGRRTAKQQLFDAAGFRSTTKCLEAYLAQLTDEMLVTYKPKEVLRTPVSDDEFDDLLASLENDCLIAITRDSEGEVIAIKHQPPHLHSLVIIEL